MDIHKDRHQEQERRIDAVVNKLDGIKKQVNEIDKNLIEIKTMQKFYLRQRGIDPEDVIRDRRRE